MKLLYSLFVSEGNAQRAEEEDDKKAFLLCIRAKRPLAKFLIFLAGAPGFEPGIADPKSSDGMF